MDMIISVYEILKMHQRLGKQLYIWDNWSIKSRRDTKSSDYSFCLCRNNIQF